MKSRHFQKLLFKSAVSAMAVDGEIHESEIDELKSIVRETAYFLDFDYEEELALNTNDIRRRGKEAVNDFLSELENSDLSQRQELIIIEVVIKIIEADKKIDPNEIKFLHLLKQNIKATEETLFIKFPKHLELLISINNDSLKNFDKDIKIK